MTEPFVPAVNRDSFILPYPEEIQKKTGSTGMVFSLRKFYLLLARQVDDTDPMEAAEFREIANYYLDVFRGELVERDSRGNWVSHASDWDDLTDEQKMHRGNTNAAIAALDWLRYQLEGAADEYELSEDVACVRRMISNISL